MADYSELVGLIKQAAREAVNAGAPSDVCFGTVISPSPLSILVDQKMTLTAAQLVLTRNVTDYEVQCEIDWKTETKESHKHDITGVKKMKVKNTLLAGEMVILLKQLGGQKYIVLDRIATA
ncbi:MAG: DUF2577 domain-containing protein [Lachnospiraceae bacterium]|nr:DUF2577 domain-containing protein [Lachnospiraceae bacterium]